MDYAALYDSRLQNIKNIVKRNMGIDQIGSSLEEKSRYPIKQSGDG